ncbi:hypothetical protein BHM03_00012967 [Ensete ventricosum]|nr:hypothetical protein BHM03_00012967 [Ensete ventricosum]
MKALVISIWGLCTTEGEVRLQVPLSPMEGDLIIQRIGASPGTRWWRQYMTVAVCLSIDQGELLEGHSGVEVGGRKGRGSDDESSGAKLTKSKASVRKEVDSEGHHSAAEADLPIRQDFRGVIDPLLSQRESIGRKRVLGGGECKGKLQVPRQGGRAEAKELHKIGIDGLLIKIAEREGLRVDAGVLDQVTK